MMFSMASAGFSSFHVSSMFPVLIVFFCIWWADALQPIHSAPIGRLYPSYNAVFRRSSLAYLSGRKVKSHPLRTQTRIGSLAPGDFPPSQRENRFTFSHSLQAQNNSTPTQIADDVRRRQVLMSMFAAAASVSPIVKPSSAAAVSADDSVTKTAISKEFRDIIKPPLDDREYVSYVLENGLRVLLCSDPSTNEAAAAMDVHVGACSDPAEVPGLAHFNEHMLFLGTKRFPREDSFESYLATNGGSSNAYTDSENTVYYFDIDAEADKKLAEGLLRFGAFFTDPLFTESATGRELNAIESENSKNLQSDAFRSFQMDKARANPDHPYSKFFTGNKKTLLEDTKNQGIDLREELIKFYNRYYSANQMTLAVVAPQSIDTLKDMVDKAFSEVPNRNVNKPEEAWAGISPFNNDNSVIPSFYHVVEVVPVKDLRQVNIKWPIVYRSEEDRQVALLVKPSQYVAHLIGHEGPRSLLSYLKSKGWVNSVGASTNAELSDFEEFEVVVALTSQGLASVDKVVEAVYSYIAMLRDRKIPDYVFKEVLQLEELQWRFLTKGSPRSYVTSLATSMQKFDPALYISGPRRLALDEVPVDSQIASLPRSSFSSKEQLQMTRSEVEKYVEMLNVDNGITTVMSKTFQGQTNLKERWYGTDYRVRPLGEETLDQWKNCPKANKLKIDFPNPNPFIPSEAGLRVKNPQETKDKMLMKSFEARMQPIPPPRIIRDDGPEGRWTVYFKEDNRFGKPNGYVVFEVLTAEVFGSSMNAALANLYEICVSDRLGEYAYDAGLAGLIYEVKVLPRGIRLTFGGYSDKLKKFASFVSRKLSRDVSDLLPKSEKEFERYKDQIVRALAAFDVKQPYAHGSYYAQLTLQPRRFQYSNKELREATRTASLADLESYVKSLWNSGKGEALIQGNFNEAEALELVKSIGDVLPFQAISSSEYPPRLKALPLPTSPISITPPRLLVAEPNPLNENSVSYVMLQSLGQSEKDHVMMELVNAIVEEPFYNDLRTKKQLGYIVASGVKGVENTRTLSFIVQSNVAAAESLTSEIINFLDRVESNFLEKLPKADLAVYAKSLIDKKTEPDTDLGIEVTRNWSEIASGRFQFDRRQREALALLDVEKEDLIEFWRQIYASNGRRILVTEVIPRQGAASSKLPPTSTGFDMGKGTDESFIIGIDDIDRFRSDREKLVYDSGAAFFRDFNKNNFAGAKLDVTQTIALVR